MKEVPVSGGNIALVDDEDYDLVSQYRWYALKVKKSLTTYARTTRGKKTIYMHRLIMNPPGDMGIDHVDGDGLNNQRANLAVCTQQQNMQSYMGRTAYDRWKAQEEYWSQFGKA